MTLLSAVHLVTQFALQLLVARYFGAGADVDAYVAAMTLPAILSSVLFGSLMSAFVPVYAQRRSQAGEKAADAMAVQVASSLLIVTAALAAAVFFYAELWATWLFPGFAAERSAQVVSLLRVLCGLIVLNSLTNLLTGLSQCRGHFTWPPIAGVIGTLITLLAVVLVGARWGIDAVAWAVLGGAGVSTLLLLPLLRPTYSALQVSPLPGTGRVFALLLPLALAGVYLRIDPLVDRYFASMLGVGTVSHLSYAWRLATALALVLQSGLAAVVFPSMAAHAAAHRRDELRADVARALRVLTFVVVPTCVAVVGFHEPLVRLLFERGRFTPADTAAVASLFAAYAGLIVGLSFAETLSRVFYALQDVGTPVSIGLCGLLSGITLKFVVFAMGEPGSIALRIAWVTSAVFLLIAVWLLVALVRRLGTAAMTGVVGTALRSLIASVAAWAVVSWILAPQSSLTTLFAAVLGGIVYLAGMTVLRDELALVLWKR